MAITATFTRIRHGQEVPFLQEVCSSSLSGTYATGGFTWNPLAVTGPKGTSPLPASVCYTADFYGANGYNYQTTFSGSTATTKIFTSGGTELANGTAVPDLTPTVVLLKGR